MKVVDEVEHHIAYLVDLGVSLWGCQHKIVRGNLVKQSTEIDPQLVILLGFHRKPYLNWFVIQPSTDKLIK